MNGKIEIDPTITHTVPLKDINKAFDRMHEGKSIHSIVKYGNPEHQEETDHGTKNSQKSRQKARQKRGEKSFEENESQGKTVKRTVHCLASRY
jgi:hypothetical protein